MKLYIQKNMSDVKDSYSLRALVTRLGLQINFKPQEVHWCKWKPAEQEAFMLNTDGSVQENGNGYGGTIHDGLGFVVRAYAGCSSKNSIIYQEIQAIAVGLKQPQELGIENLEVNSDSLGAINILNGNERCPWYCSNMVAYIRCLTSSIVKCSFSHIFREGNRVADYLSKLYRSPEEGVVLFSLPLDAKLHHIIEEDRIGTMYPRFSSNTG
ncbi:hypothetical protein IFM89_014074 [Coptis chinensis]|uniref:RNase H type-1 domain-containing protein n=1 Tax=Coptis chinensis TaxID=261450 RepID=A0A835HMA7_9MAGN|nr:hypothetical protein IFM89_014074 [Coptis chinensis]